MRTVIQLYPHMIADTSNMSMAFLAIDICQKTAESIAAMFNGVLQSNLCGVVQFDNIVVVEYMSEDQQDVLKKAFPFLKIKHSSQF